MEEGFITINRRLQQWEFVSDPLMLALWIHLLLQANHKRNEWQGVTLERGQLVTTIAGLAATSGLTVKQVRARLDKLVAREQITREHSNRYTIITISNYDKYQLGVAAEECEAKDVDKPYTEQDYQRNDDFLADITQPTAQREGLLMRYHISTTQLDGYLQQFLLDCKCRGTVHPDRKDAINHFNSWLRILLENNETNRTQTQSRRRGVEATPNSAEDYEAAF